MLLHIFKVIFFISCLFFLGSCVKDTSFDQANDIVLQPEIELDLIHFNLQASSFYNSEINTPNLVVKDTTNIEFLDGRDLQDALKRAEFLFKFTNSIPQSFTVSFDFLTPNNNSTFFTETTVNQGTIAAPVLTDFIENVDEQEIENLTKANKVVITVTIPSSNADLTGVLNLQSKTTYYLEID